MRRTLLILALFTGACAHSQLTHQNSQANANYLKAIADETKIHQAAFDQNVRVLAGFGAPFNDSINGAASKLGYDLKSYKPDLEQFGTPAPGEEIVYLDKVTSYFKGLNEKLQPVFSASGINGQAKSSDLIATLRGNNQNLAKANMLPAGYVGAYLPEVPLAQDPRKDPPSGATEIDMTAPYALTGSQGFSWPTYSSGLLYVRRGYGFAGSGMALGYVGGSFVVDPAVRHVRVRAQIGENTCSLLLFGFLGYASGEALLNLRVTRGSTTVVLQRLSLMRAWSSVGCFDDRMNSSSRTLIVEFDRTPGDTNTDYSVAVEGEVWAGCGGLSSALSVVRAHVQSIHVWLTY